MSLTVKTFVAKVANDTIAFEILINNNKVKSNHLTIVLTLDYSGSMHGNPIEYGRMATSTALKEAIKHTDDIILILYNHRSEVIFVNKNNIDSVTKRVESLQSSGSTNYIEVFQAVTKILHDRQKVYKNKIEFIVSFFTDGRHYNSTYDANDKAREIDMQRMYDSLNQFRLDMNDKNIKEVNGTTKVVARGYSADNDLHVLNNISKTGIVHGDYKYASTYQDIAKILAIDELILSTNDINAYVCMGVSFNGSFDDSSESKENIVKHQLEFIDIKSDTELLFTHSATLFIPVSEFEKYDNKKLTLILDDEKISLTNIIVQEYDSIPAEVWVDILGKYCGYVLFKISNEVINMQNKPSSNDLLKILQNRLADLGSYIDTQWQSNQKNKKKNIRKIMYDHLIDMKNQINKMADNLSELIVRGINNDRLSNILSAGHSAKNVTKSGFRNLLTKRLDKNITHIQQEDGLIDELSSKFDAKKYENDNNDLQCYITLSKWSELVENGDVLCLTGMMARSQIAIVDPSKIMFKTIYPMFNNMSFSTFQEELTYKLNGSKDNEDRLHGGFKFNFKKPSGVVTAFSNQQVNFVYPMYICADHWNIAKHYIRRTFGWMTTLDWAGYDFQQIKIIPFSILSNAINSMLTDGVTESSIQKYFNLARVAKQLIVDYNMTSIEDDFANWNKSPLFRTGDLIKDILIFLIKLLFMKGHPNIDNEFWLSVYEEMFRRGLRKYTKNNRNCGLNLEDIASHHNYKQYIEDYSDESNKLSDSCKFRNEMISALKQKNIVVPNDDTNDNKSDTLIQTESKDVKKFDATTCIITPVMMKPIDTINQELQYSIKFMFTIRKLYDYMRNLNMDNLYDKLDENYGVIDKTHIDSFKHLELAGDYNDICSSLNITNKYVYAMLIQNIKHNTHLKRREAASDGTYMNPFNDLSFNTLLQNLVDKSIRDETSHRSTLHINDINKGYSDLFKNTKDINTAAGIILKLCQNIGDPLFVCLYKQLQDGSTDTPLFLEKVSLLVEGEYNGIRLYKDIKEDVPIRWATKWINMYRIITAYRKIVDRSSTEYTMTNADWLNIFRWRQTIDGKYVIKQPSEFPPNNR